MSISPRELGAILGHTRLPAILQAEVAECGLACVAMVASYHGSRIELGELRRRFPTSSKGVTLQGLMALARKLKLDTRAIKLDLASVKQLILPCILHWDLNHFVVLRSVNRKSVTIHDPAVGERTLSLTEFGKHFSGVALELSPSADFRPVELGQKVRFGDVLGRVVGLGRGAAQVVGLALALELVAICMPFQLQWVIDQALLASDMDLVGTLSIGFLLLVVLQAAIFALRGWVIATLSTNLNFQWLGNVFAHLLKLPIPYFERRHLGAIQSYFGSVTHMQRTITTGFTQVAVDGVLVIGTSIVMLLYSIRLSLIAATALMIYVAVKWLLFKRLRDATEEEIVCGAKQHTHFLETVRGIQGVRLFGRDDERRMGWMNMLAEQFNAHLRIEKIELAQRTANVLVFGVERVLIVWLASVAVMRTELTLGMLFAFMAYKEQFTTRMSALVDKAFEFSMLGVHMERISDIVLTEPDQEESEKEFDLGSALPSIELRRISFRYSPTDDLVLDGVDLRIEAGECVAITGASGSGKTTLTKILLGLFPPTSGDVLLGGVPIKRVGIRNFRSLIGTVMQDDVLYTGSIADNISFFDPVPDMGHILNCAAMAAIHDEIEKMPMGYDSLVGDIGTGLSGGQRQRILLARALYRRPKVLVLDEASSHLDIASEHRINDTIRSMKLTRILIAHRPETIAMADRVIVLDGGSIHADVEHESVLKRQTAVLDAVRSQRRLGEC